MDRRPRRARKRLAALGMYRAAEDLQPVSGQGASCPSTKCQGVHCPQCCSAASRCQQMTQADQAQQRIGSAAYPLLTAVVTPTAVP